MRMLLFCAVALALFGCGSKDGYTPKPATKPKEAVVNPGEEASLFPVEEGNQWVYAVESPNGTAELTLKVVSVVEENGAKLATIQSSMGANEPTTSRWRVDSTGVYQISDGPNRVFDPPQLLIAFPLEKDKVIEQNLTGPHPAGGGTGPLKMTSKYVGVQEVDTDMDRLSALAVESVTTWTTANGEAASRGVTWWSPNIGFVRQRQEIGTTQGPIAVTLKLKSYSFR